jgi:hypothetical protein
MAVEADDERAASTPEVAPERTRTMKRFISRKLALTIAVLAVGVTVVGGIAAASIPSATDGAITACVTAEGAPRIIDADADQGCNDGETRVSWGPGWKARGMWAVDQMYEPGDVVQAPARFAMGAAQCAVSTGAVYVKAEAGAEKPSFPPFPAHPCYDSTWVKLFSFPDPPPIGSIRIGVSDNGVAARLTPHTRYELRTWNFVDGTAWLHVEDRYPDRSPVDVRECAVTALPVGAAAPATVIRQQIDYTDWILLYTYVGNRRANFAVDATISCR